MASRWSQCKAFIYKLAADARAGNVVWGVGQQKQQSLLSPDGIAEALHGSLGGLVRLRGARLVYKAGAFFLWPFVSDLFGIMMWATIQWVALCLSDVCSCRHAVL